MMTSHHIMLDYVILSLSIGDFLHPHLTVYETLACSANLRLPTHLSHAEKMEKAENVISELGLRHCRDTRIGNDEVPFIYVSFLFF